MHKHYPKKYYACASHSLPFSGTRDALSICCIDSSPFRIQDAIDAITKQVLLSYSDIDSIAQGFLYVYDTLAAYTSDDTPHSLFTDVYRSFDSMQSHLALLGLIDAHAFVISASDLSYRIFVKKAVQSLFDKGYLVQQKVNCFWDFVAGISVPDTMVSWVPRPQKVHRVRCFIDSKKDSIVIHLADIHLLFAIVAVAVHPGDRRYKKMIGKKVIIPIINRIVPIVGDESVSITQCDGIKAIVPCHDRESLVFAYRHHLPMDVFAVDAYGVFADTAHIYAGKVAQDFSSNIIQYLQDIHNYDGVDTVVMQVPYCAHTNRYIGFFIQDGWMLSLDGVIQHIIDFVGSDTVVCSSSEKDSLVESLSSLSSLLLSASHGMVGIAQTTGMQQPLDRVFAYYSNKSLKKDAALSAILYDMIYDGLLPVGFVVEQCIDILFTQNTFCDGFLWQQYAQLIASQYGTDIALMDDIQAFESLCHRISHGDIEAMDSFVVMLDHCIILQKQGHGYTLSDDFALSYRCYASPSLLHACLPAYMYTYNAWSARDFCLSRDDINIEQFVMQFVLFDAMGIDFPTVRLIGGSLVSSHNVLSFEKHCIVPLQYYSSDTVRLALLTNTIDDIASQELIVQKIWNVCRYIYMHFSSSGLLNVSVSQNIVTLINQDISQLTVFDQWMIYRFMELASKLQDTQNILFSLDQNLTLLYECIVDDFSVKYIEISKQRKGPLSPWVMLLGIGMICTMLHPILPLLVAQIRNLFGMDFGSLSDLHTMQLSSKNYKIHLLMMIIGSLKKLKQTLLIKNHEKVSVCLQGSSDIVAFVQEYRSLLDSIVGIDVLDFYSPEKDIPGDYLQESVVDICLGVKASAPLVSDVDRLYIVLKEKSEYLQHLRALLSTGSYPDKELKIAKLKEEIQHIEYTIALAQKK